MESEESLYSDQEALLKRDKSSLALPPRTGRGARRRKEVSGKKKAAAVGVAAMLGSVAVVAVFNPFGGDNDSIFGEIAGGDAPPCCCGGGGGDAEGDCEADCDECCDSCTIL